MRHEIPDYIRSFLNPGFGGDTTTEFDKSRIRPRAFLVGSTFSFFLAIGAPYGNMLVKGAYVAQDATAPGAFLVFLFVVGCLNMLFKLEARGPATAQKVAGASILLFIWAFWPLDSFDPYSPHLIFSCLVLGLLLLNAALVIGRGSGLTLNRSELVLVFIMLVVVSVVCTLGLSSTLLPTITGFYYFATPSNRWLSLAPHLPSHRILVDDGNRNTSFYEGLEEGAVPPYGAWIEPLLWWAILIGAVYCVMVSAAVILRRQWMDRERLPYPLAQVPLALLGEEREDRLVNRYLKSRMMWAGAALPLVIGSLKAWSVYNPAILRPTVFWMFNPFDIYHFFIIQISFIWIGFSYFINTKIAASLWIFHLLSKLEVLAMVGLDLDRGLSYVRGFSLVPFIGYQGFGALMAMVLTGLWIARGHLREVWRKALGGVGEVDDATEVLSYRKAVVGTILGLSVAVVWFWIMGMPLWIASLFIGILFLTLIGISRYVAEAGLVRVSSPVAPPELILKTVGTTLVGGPGVLLLPLSYAWALTNTNNLMSVFASGLRLTSEVEVRSRRYLAIAVVLALIVGIGGAFWMNMHLAYRYGGINLHGSYFIRFPADHFNISVANLAPAGVYWDGLVFVAAGAGIMLLLILAQMRLPWWPLHPIGFPVGMTLYYPWFNIFVAWLVKVLVLRYGGAAAYRRTQPFFFGLITGHCLCIVGWIIIDSFTGQTWNITLQM